MTQGRRHQPAGAAKMAVAVLIALAAVLAPVEAPHAPEPIVAVFGISAAAAQTSPGTPGACPDLGRAVVNGEAVVNWPDPHDDAVMNSGLAGRWRPQPADADDATSPVCVLEIDACPPVPWAANPAVFMQSSREFPDFCEIAFDASDPSQRAMHTTCAANTGSSTALVTDDGGTCTVRAPMHCPVGIRIAHDTCQVTLRRSWSCAALLLPGNGFNTCFENRATVADPASHPACGMGAPDFGSLSCADYAGTDYLDNPGDPNRRCDTHQSYITGLSPLSLQDVLPATAASVHWCSYNARLLDTRCHSSPTDQPYSDGDCAQPQRAYCLKRSGDTGGCTGVAHTISCAALLVPHLADYRRADDPAVLRLQGCAPCIVLPFTPSTTSCPDDVARDPHQASVNPGGNACGPTESEILEARDDLDHDGRIATASGSCGNTADTAHTVCPDPARAALSWGTNHLAGRAVVNAPVTFRVDHVPTRRVQSMMLRERGVNADDLDRYAWPSGRTSRGLTPVQRYFSIYSTGSQVVQTVGSPSPATPVGSLHDLVHRLCTLEEEPAFIIEIEELWPDVDRLEIEQNFDVNLTLWHGSTSAALAEQERLTSLRGLRWTGAMSDPEEQAEIDRRSRERTALASCNSTPRQYRLPFTTPHNRRPDSAQETQMWCRWTPDRSGWFKVTALGAWQLRVNPRPEWRPQADIEQWINWLNRDNGRPFDAYYLPYTTADVTRANNSMPWWVWCWQRDNQNSSCASTRVDFSKAHFGYVPTPADFGLKSNPDGTFVRPVVAMDLPDPLSNDELYRFDDTASRTELSRRSRYCESMDIRIRCGSGEWVRVGKYTESEPVYLQVHEVRTRSVPTSP